MVMGVQRSGTSALFESLAYDESLTPFNESIDSLIYYQYRLRPLPEIAPLLDATPGPVLLKPICETLHRSLEELVADHHDYDVRMVWIFRDPVNVFYSMHRQGWVPSFDITHPCYSSEWVRRNQLALQFQRSHPNQIVFIRYKDCATDPLIFRQIATWLGVKGRSVFRRDSNQGRRRLPPTEQQKIDRTAEGSSGRSAKSRSTLRRSCAMASKQPALIQRCACWCALHQGGRSWGIMRQGQPARTM